MIAKTSRKLAMAGIVSAAVLLLMPMLPAVYAASYTQTFPMQTNVNHSAVRLYSLHSFYTTEGNSYFGTSTEWAWGQSFKHKSAISTSGNFATAYTELPYRIYSANVYTLSDIRISVLDPNGNVQNHHFKCPSGNNYATFPLPDRDGPVRIQITTTYNVGWWCY